MAILGGEYVRSEDLTIRLCKTLGIEPRGILELNLRLKAEELAVVEVVRLVEHGAIGDVEKDITNFGDTESGFRSFTRREVKIISETGHLVDH